MQLERLLSDVTQLAAGASRRQQHIALARLLNERHGSLDPISEKGVAKWFERGSIPSPWLMRIAALPTSWHQQPLNLSDYA